MTRRLTAAALVVGLLTAALGGCGIPDETSVVVHGPGPSPGPVAGGESANTPKARDEATDRGEFVDNYLAAAAGDINSAADRVREYIAPGSRNAFNPPREINVVRLTENPLISPGKDEVKLRVQPLGVLSASGTLEQPARRSEVVEHSLVVTEAPGASGGRGGWYVTNPPPVLLLSDTALSEFYYTRSIYFWNRERTALVPDLRYVPHAWPPERQPNEVLKWLIDGPAGWLESAVEPLPDDTAPIGNVPDVSNGKLQINLSAAAVPADDKAAIKRLAWQLMWSMRTSRTTSLELKIANTPRGVVTGDEYLAGNPAYRLAGQPERFCVYGGQVRRITHSGNLNSPVPLLTPKVNRGVRAAALSRAGDTTYGALVVAAGAGQSLVTGAARSGAEPRFHSFRLPAGSTSRPVWLTPSAGGGPGAGVGLLAVNGRLQRIGTAGLDPQNIELPGTAGPVTAVAAAADGLRVAFVAGGRLYVTVLTRNGTALQAAVAREVRTSLRQLSGVDFSGENSVVVAGLRADNGRVAIVDVSVDGALETPRLNDLGAARVTHLTAHPANPVAATSTTAPDADALVAYVANDIAYDLSGVPDAIDAGEVFGVAVSPGATQERPSAPFFLR